MSTGLPIERWSMAELVPHGGPMVLLDRVLEAKGNSLTVSARIDERCPFIVTGATSMDAWWALEYLAQGVAALAGLRARAAGREVARGYLTSCRRFSSSAPQLALPATAEITVTEVVAVDASLAAFQCRMQAGQFVAESLISVFGTEQAAEHADN